MRRHSVSKAFVIAGALPSEDTTAAWRNAGFGFYYVSPRYTPFDTTDWPYGYGHLLNIVGKSSDAVVAQLYIARAGNGVWYRYQTSVGNLAAWRRLSE